MAHPLSPIEHAPDAFECLDCFLVAELNVHGRCARCDSNAVMPEMMLKKAGRGIKTGNAPFLVTVEQLHMKAGDSNLRVSEQPRHCRTLARNNTPLSASAPVMRKKYA